MKATDARNLTWEQIRGHLAGMRERVYRAFVSHGAGTTQEVAAEAGISILTLRPRTTELVSLGLVEIISVRDGEGVYRAIPLDRAQAHHAARLAGNEQQMQMSL